MIMKKSVITLLLLLVGAIPLLAQKAEWTSPFVGYSNTSTLTVDKVEFEKGKTVMHVTAAAPEGTSMKVSSDAYLSADGKQYAIKKVSRLGMDKEYVMPDSGRVHFAMQFEPLPADTRLLHFVEGKAAGGWKLCNIRKDKGDLKTIIPEEWKNIEYANNEELPVSRFSDDSTTVRIAILNYVPEAGNEIRVDVASYFDMDRIYETVSIAEDGTATIGLHPCFPTTIRIRINGYDEPVLVVPGKELYILKDWGNGRNGGTIAYKGMLARTNYELNVLGGRNLISYDYSTAYFDSLYSLNRDVSSHFFLKYRDDFERIRNCKYSDATKEWMLMRAYLSHYDHLAAYNRYVERKVKENLEASDSPILDNSYVWRKIKEGLSVTHGEYLPAELPFATKMTISDYYQATWRGVDESEYNKDIQTLFWSLVYNETYSYENGLKNAGKIKDSELKAFYPVAAQRWQQYVDAINKTPNIHFDTMEASSVNEGLKERLVGENKGKALVFLVYNSEVQRVAQELDELEEQIRKAGEEEISLIHFDTYPGGVKNWYEAAVRRTGEHYGGKRTRYDSLFPDRSFVDKTVYYEIYSPDGTCMLKTDNKEEAFKAIEKLLK